MLRRFVSVVILTFAALLTVLSGLASAEGEQIVGTLSSGASGPIEGVTVTVTTADGDEVGDDQTDENGRFEIDLPGAGDYVASLDAGELPEGVTSASTERPVTVGAGRAQRVAFALSDGSVGQGGGSTITVLQRFVEGLRFGLIIAITAIGLSLIYGTTGLTNFAHGELVAVGATVAFIINVSFGVQLIWATVMAVIVGAAFGGLNDLLLWRPLRRRRTGLIAMLVVSIGLSIVLRYVLLIRLGGGQTAYSDYTSQRAKPYLGGIITLTDKDLASIILSVVVLVGVALMLQRTRIGKAMRAVADNRDLAAASGINVDRVILFVWMLGGGLAAFGGVLYGLSDQVAWDMGFRLLLLMFAGVTLGGLGTAYGALVGSLIVGVFVQMSTLVIPDELKNVGGLLLLIVILVVRPSGILGARERVG
ncbi:MAG: branched-chain amino acid ABC transporter permease [Geodermatophilaceae bacterium]